MSIGNSVYSIILEWQQSDDNLPTSSIFAGKISFNISTVHLGILGTIRNFQWIAATLKILIYKSYSKFALR
jgi:hypothetical protein